MKNLTLIIPAKNESESLPDVINELGGLTCLRKVVLKQDDILTVESIKNLNVEIVYQGEYGYGDALITGINSVKTEYFCIFNADGSFDPKEIPSFIEMLENEKNDFVFGSRYEKNSGSEDDTLVTYVGNKIFTALGRLFFNLPITDILYTFVLGKTEKAKKLNLKQKDFSFCVELPIKAKRNNMKLSSITCYERKRIAGKKKVNALKDGLLILTHMIKLYFK